MQQSSAKKRRLAVLERAHGGSAGASSNRTPPAAAKQQQHRPRQPALPDVQPPPQAAAAAAAAGGEEGSTSRTGAFPYQPLHSVSVVPSHVASRLQLPPEQQAAAAAGHNIISSSRLDDALERLMAPHMPPPTARTMIAGRLAPDKAVILSNPAGRVNLARPSAAARGRRRQLADRLLPRAQRSALADLPASGVDYAALLALHDLWAKHAGGLLAHRRGPALAGVLQALDWHGALLRVVASSNPAHMHRAGIVAKATARTFVLVSEDGRSSTIPLKGSCFVCAIPCGQQALLNVTITGDSAHTLKCSLEEKEEGGAGAAAAAGGNGS